MNGAFQLKPANGGVPTTRKLGRTENGKWRRDAGGMLGTYKPQRRSIGAPYRGRQVVRCRTVLFTPVPPYSAFPGLRLGRSHMPSHVV